MGAPESEYGCDPSGLKPHVQIRRAFCMKSTEVTQGEWQAVMGNNPSYFAAWGADSPVESVSWWDAVAYCNALSVREGLAPCYVMTGCTGEPGTGIGGVGAMECESVTMTGLGCTGYRLPTQAEWEYAARAGTTTATYNGDPDPAFPDCFVTNPVVDPIAWYCANSRWEPGKVETTCSSSSPPGTCGVRPVKGKLANPWGVYDILGNVEEWCWDRCGSDAYPGGSLTDPWGPGTGGGRMSRGGSWIVPVSGVEASSGVCEADPRQRGFGGGFRTVRALPGSCTPQDHRVCLWNSVYWVDRCGALGDWIEDCAYGCTDSACNPCPPDCGNRTCGCDGCGGSCGSCLPGEACQSGQCVCVPDCAGRVCGDDGCGGSCGTCGATETCRTGQCVANPCPEGFVPVPAGQFNMGAPETEPGYWWGCDDETVHRVTLSRPYCMKRTEVTQAEWKAVMGNNASAFATCGDDCPVERVNWYDALAWCNARSEAEGLAPCYTLTGCTGKPGSGPDPATWYQCTGVAFAGSGCTGYRLPTEAEWEYAARAGTTAGTYGGPPQPGHLACEHPNVLDAIAWYAGTSCAQSSDGSCRTTDCGTQPVATKRPNDWGLHDMLGNVFEWCWDAYAPFLPGPATDPVGPDSGDSRVRRGGGFESTAAETRAAYRSWSLPSSRSDQSGFRPARTLPP